jgi:hypothetical protein
VLFGLQVGYSVSGHSANRPVLHGVDLRLSLNARIGLEVFAGYVVRQPIAITDRQISIDIRTHPTFLGVGWQLALGRFYVGGGAELTMSYMIQETRKVASETAVPRDHRDLLVSLAPYAAGAFALIPDRLALRVQVAVQFVLNPVRYVVETYNTEQVIDAPWSIVPIGVMELVFLI